MTSDRKVEYRIRTINHPEYGRIIGLLRIVAWIRRFPGLFRVAPVNDNLAHLCMQVEQLLRSSTNFLNKKKKRNDATYDNNLKVNHIVGNWYQLTIARASMHSIFLVFKYNNCEWASNYSKYVSVKTKARKKSKSPSDATIEVEYEFINVYLPPYSIVIRLRPTWPNFYVVSNAVPLIASAWRCTTRNF